MKKTGKLYRESESECMGNEQIKESIGLTEIKTLLFQVEQFGNVENDIQLITDEMQSNTDRIEQVLAECMRIELNVT